MATLTAPDAVSMDSQKLREVEALFKNQISNGLHPGAGLAVYRYGMLVLDLNDGLADSDTAQPVSDETMFVLFSSIKPIAASCLYILQDRGELAWDDPVFKHWPKFGQHGKEAVTIRHILTHQEASRRRRKTCPGPIGPTGTRL